MVEDIKRLRLVGKTKLVNKSLKKLDRLKKTKKKVERMAVAMSSPTKVIREYGVPLLDVLHSVIEAAKSARDYVGEDLLKFLLDLFTTLYNIYVNPEWKGVVLNVTNFFVRNFKQIHADLALSWFKQSFGIAKPQAANEEKPFSDYILSFFKMSENFINDKLWGNIGDFFSKVMTLYAAGKEMVSVETLDFEVICTKFREFREHLPTITDLVEMAFESYKFIAGNWQNILTGNWSKLLLGKDESKVFELEVRELEQAYNFVLSGQEIELKNIYNMTPDEYESRLTKAVATAKSLIVRATSVQQRMSVSNFIKKLTEMQSDLWARKADAPSKEEAYAIKMSGPSSCGKSTMIKLMAKTILNAYGRDPSESGSVVFTNVDEKFESTILPSHRIIVADDVANNKNSNPNYDRLLNYVNTIPRPLEKASAEEKGKYYPGNDALIATTNDETIRAMECSVCPESILRRFAIDVEVSIRPEFRNEFGGLIKQESLRFDVYSLVLKRFRNIIVNEKKQSEIEWDIIPRREWNPHEDDEHDFHAMCSFIAKDIAKHRRRQHSQSIIQKQLDECGFCETCRCPDIICSCSPDSTGTGSNPSNPSSDSSSTYSFYSQEDPNAEEEDGWDRLPYGFWYDQAPDMDDSDDASFKSCNENEEQPVAVAQFGLEDFWRTLTTQELWDYRACLTDLQFLVCNASKTSMLWHRLYQDRKLYMYGIGTMMLSGLFCTVLTAKYAQTLSMCALMYMGFMYTRTIQQIDEEIANRRDQLSAICQDISTHLEHNARKYFAVSGGVFLAYGFYKAMKPFLIQEGVQDKSSFLNETTDLFARIVDYPAEGENVFEVQDRRDYKEGYSRLPPKDTATSKTTTSEDLQKSVARALRMVVVKSKGQVYGSVNGIMVASNVLLVPSHVIPYNFPFDIETTTTPGTPSASTKDQKLTEEYCYIDRVHDHAFIHLASSPASTSYAKFFPEEYPDFYNRTTVMLWKSPQNEVKVSRQAARPLTQKQQYGGYIEHPGFLWGHTHKLKVWEIAKGEGLTYTTEFRGFGGLCGALLLDAYTGIIYGFHVAGLPNSHVGWATCVLQSHITKGLESLKETSPTMVVHSANDIHVDTYGTPHSIINQKPLYLREDGRGEKAIVTYVGTVLKDGQHMESRARTPYIKTPFKGVELNLGERKHRPPTKPNDVGKAMKTLNKLMDPVQHYEGDILLKAIADYREQTLRAISSDPEASEVLRIYTQEEAMDGIGTFGLSGLPNDTSAGFPIQKSKKHCLKRDVMDETNVQVPREFNDSYDIQSEIDKTMECWSNELRSEPIYKASSKVNELLPDKKAQEKVRKFYGSPFANFVASRRALAGIPRIMKKHWRATECLIGINPLSREWDEFHKYLTEYSTTNMIAGDFAGYDTRMAAQITTAASKIMISWYQEAGCTVDEIRLIQGALSDIVHPNILFEGDLYRFANGNPSGNLITAQMNSVCNSIMMRYVYYAMMPNIKQRFSENVRLGTYGDDNAMSVKKHCKWYNHTACQEQFDKLDIGYTMADKNAKSRPYITVDEISFLKRGFLKHVELNIVVGPIETDSILKKFHWVKKPGESPLSFAEQFGAYTDGAIREQYLYGRTAYEDFLQKLRNIVAMNDDLRGVVNFIPYDEMTLVLQPDYADDYVNKNEKLDAESLGVHISEL